MEIDSVVLILALFGAFMLGFIAGLLAHRVVRLFRSARQAPGRLVRGISHLGTRLRQTLRPKPKEGPAGLPEIPLPSQPIGRAVAIALTFPMQRARILFELGEEAFAAGQYRAAERHFQIALIWDRGRALPPLHVRANKRLGEIRAMRDDIEGAIVAYERVRDIDPANVEAYMQLGQLYFRVGRPGQAIYELGRAIELDPTNLDVRYHLFQIYQQSGMQQEALRQLRLLKAGEDPQVIAQLFLGHGREHLRQGSLGMAGNDYHLVLELTPDEEEAVWALGDILRLQEEDEEALHLWARGLWHNPSPALDERLLALARTGFWEEVAMVYQRALLLRPRMGRFYLALGNMAHECSRSEEASGYWERAVAVQPDLVEAHLRLEEHYKDAAAPERAQRHLRAAVRALWGREMVFRCRTCEHVTPVEQPYCFVCGTWDNFEFLTRTELEVSTALVPAALTREARNVIHRLGNWWTRLRGFLLGPPEEKA